ncbi:MAG: D-galactonate dehydratase family protein [Devosia nanyangense]|uniref:D-galactonate dehydratase family protein n=1 Tax=Devosia nanyangense TaxID=1228055 RepID=A0A933L6M0_9HYPH|nr:D-galactonate dehydratase family protein [Devosia nanyangense]
MSDRIIAARVVVCSPGRNYVTLIIETASGLTGIGDATLNGRELAVASYLADHVAPLLIGRDPAQIEDIWQYLYRGAYWRRGPVTMTAIAGIDVALWDIKAKAAGMPLYQLLGGASRERMLCYTHADGADIAEALDAVAAKREHGFRAVRVQAGVPGLNRIYGVHGDGAGDSYARPIEGDWDTSAYLRHTPKLFEAARERFGPELHLLHDAHHRLTPNEAAQLGRSLEPYRLFWVEDPVTAEAQEGWRRVRSQTTVPLAVGEVFNSIWDAQLLITERLVDYLRATIVHAGGITHVRRIADLCALYSVRTGFHGANDLSPVTMGAALHFGRWVPNFGIQEYAAHPAQAEEVFGWDWSYAGGHLLSGEAAGHGVTFDEQAAARFPYRRQYLDVNRLTDGTMWDW